MVSGPVGRVTGLSEWVWQEWNSAVRPYRLRRVRRAPCVECRSVLWLWDTGLVEATGQGTRGAIPSGVVTFLFTDVEGSTQRWASDADRMAASLRRHDELIRAVVSEHDGYVFATAGDAFCVAFDRASTALEAARQMQLRLDVVEWPGPALSVRIGDPSRRGRRTWRRLLRLAVNTAARVAAAGHGGQVLVTDLVMSAVGSDALDFGMIDLGDHSLRDVPRSGSPLAGRGRRVSAAANHDDPVEPPDTADTTAGTGRRRARCSVDAGRPSIGHLGRRRRNGQDAARDRGGRCRARTLARRRLVRRSHPGQQRGRRRSADRSGGRLRGPFGGLDRRVGRLPGAPRRAGRAGQLRARGRRLRRHGRSAPECRRTIEGLGHQPGMARHRRRAHLPGSVARHRRSRQPGGQALCRPGRRRGSRFRDRRQQPAAGLRVVPPTRWHAAGDRARCVPRRRPVTGSARRRPQRSFPSAVGRSTTPTSPHARSNDRLELRPPRTRRAAGLPLARRVCRDPSTSRRSRRSAI